MTEADKKRLSGGARQRLLGKKGVALALTPADHADLQRAACIVGVPMAELAKTATMEEVRKILGD